MAEKKIISGAMVFSLSFLELFHVGVDLRAAFRSHLSFSRRYTVYAANQSASKEAEKTTSLIDKRALARYETRQNRRRRHLPSLEVVF